MRKLFRTSLALLIAAPLLVQAQTNTAATDPTADPTAATAALFKAMLDENTSGMQAVTTNDFSITSFSGQTADRDLMGEALSGGYLVVDEAAPLGARARVYNNDAAVVSGTSRFKGSLQGTAFNTDVVFTALCVKQGSAWKVASLQFSPGK